MGFDALRARLLVVGAVSLAGSTVFAEPGFGARALTLEERVEAQRAIERTYWEHRIWPAANPMRKPALEELLPDSALRNRALDTLAKSEALDALWHRPVTHEALQAELDRIVRQTRAPSLLRDILAALDDDPYLIAEVLARRTLVDRLIRDWYYADPRLHTAVREQAEQALAASRLVTGSTPQWAVVNEQSWELLPDQGGSGETSGYQDARLRRIGESLAPGEWSEIVELRDSFVALRLVERDDTKIRAVSASWDKVGFDTWWSTESARFPGNVQPIGGHYSLTAPRGADCDHDRWSDLELAPEGRGSHTAVWTGTEMIIWGGAGVAELGDGARYDPATNAFTPTSLTNAPLPRASHSAVWTGTEMIVWGGIPSPGGVATGGRYNPQSDTWVALPTLGAPSHRSGHLAVWTGTRMLVWGGTDGSNGYATGGRYDPASNSWKPMSTVGVPQGRVGASGVWTGTELVVWGGIPLSADVPPLSSGGRYSPATDSWVATNNQGAPAARWGHTAVWTGNEMIVWGGVNNTAQYFASGARYSPNADVWTPISSTGAPVARSGHTAVWTGSEMIVWGGNSGSGASLAGGRYDVSSDSWTPVSQLGGPDSHRWWHTAVWTGSEMIVWGGFDNTGGRYEPTSDSWVLTPESGPTPSPRYQHVLLWTGAEMLVWGGTDSFMHVASGGRYDLATASWTTLSGPLEGRWHAATVWTGTEMIAFGGNYFNLVTGTWATDNKGVRYNPTTNVWTMLPTAGAPNGWQANVWSGTEMIVWALSSPGARYSPTTNHWTPMSEIGEPSWRFTPAYVWAGSEMIVWGGYLNDETFYDGARYNPVTNQWGPMEEGPPNLDEDTAVWTGSQMLISGTPGARYDPSADQWSAISDAGGPGSRIGETSVWTGSEMIVWGGTTLEGSGLNTGWRYDVASDNWLPTSIEPRTPSARHSHGAVWTGEQMLIWGGRILTDELADGGAYCLVFTDTDADGVSNDFDFDDDGDATLDVADCVPLDPSAWAAPQPVVDLMMDGTGPTELTWSAPAQAGATNVTYDVLRFATPTDLSGPECLVSDSGETVAFDVTAPPPQELFAYLIRVRNLCGDTVGTDSEGVPREVGDCP